MQDEKQLLDLRDQAISLRRAGKSRREIKAITGIASNEFLTDALRGIPPPPWTRRPNAKDALRARARDLRAAGCPYNEIAEQLGVSNSSVSLWVRDMPRLSDEEMRTRKAEGGARYWPAERPRRAASRLATVQCAATHIGEVNERETLIAGAIAYWCEGAKNKPHRPVDRVTFINSDPQLIMFFLGFLSVAGIELERVNCRLYIHESADVAAAQKFRVPTLKRHNRKTIRKNIGDSYRGCLQIDVRRSSDLYRQIEGWALAAMAPQPGTGAASLRAGSVLATNPLMRGR